MDASSRGFLSKCLLLLGCVGLASVMRLAAIENQLVLFHTEHTGEDIIALEEPDEVVSFKAPHSYPKDKIEVVIGHCRESIDWLDRFNTCENIHFQIYSPCGADTPEFRNIKDCVTVHRKQDCFREIHSYFLYVTERWDSLPPIVAFLQGGALTENPHIINDVLNYIPGTMYTDMSRHVRGAWHFPEDPMRRHFMKMMTPHLFERKTWLTGWRSQFMVSGEALKRVPLAFYEEFNAAMCGRKCNLNIDCNIEIWIGAMFGCVPHLYEGEACTTKVHPMSRQLFVEDLTKDSMMSMKQNIAIETTEMTCGNRTLLSSQSSTNGLFTCVERDPAEQVDFREELFTHHAETFPDLSNLTWKFIKTCEETEITKSQRRW